MSSNELCIHLTKDYLHELWRLVVRTTDRLLSEGLGSGRDNKGGPGGEEDRLVNGIFSGVSPQLQGRGRLRSGGRTVGVGSSSTAHRTAW